LRSIDEQHTEQTVTDSGSPKSTAVSIGRELGEQADERVEGQDGDLQEVRLSGTISSGYDGGKQETYVRGLNEMAEAIDLAFREQASIHTRKGWLRSFKCSSPVGEELHEHGLGAI
jgi:hypothetical protein